MINTRKIVLLSALLMSASSIAAPTYAMDDKDGSALSTSGRHALRSSYFPNDGEYVTFSTRPLMFAVEQDDPRAKNLRDFLIKTYDIIWNSVFTYKLPLLQKDLDGDLEVLFSQNQDLKDKVTTAIMDIYNAPLRGAQN
jgi:hypothetical protein